MRVENDKISYLLNRLGVFEKLIIVNVLIFLVNHLLTFFINQPSDYFLRYFELPKKSELLLSQPWSLITYAFVHYSFTHLFWNMLMLYFVGRFFVNFFGVKNFLTIYLLGALVGGFFFWLSYNLFPVFMEVDSALVGASAGIAAVLIYICTYLPRTEVSFFFFRIQLMYIGLAFVVLDLVQLPTSNPGGHLAHLGGAALGFFLAGSMSQKGGDFSFFNFFQKMFKPKSKLRSVYNNKNTATGTKSKGLNKTEKQKKIDHILDKISESGYDTLTKEEKDFLFQSGKE